MKRVVVTGMVPVCSVGSDNDEVFSALCEKKQRVEKIEKNNEAREKLKTEYYVPYPEFDDSEFKKQLHSVKARGSKSAYTASFAALKALKHAGIEEPDDDTEVYMGVGAPNMNELCGNTLSFAEKNKISAMFIPSAMQSSLAAWISIVLGIHGRSTVLSMACASGTEAVGTGFERIRSGHCRMALCGGSDYLSDENLLIVKGFEMLKCVSTGDSKSAYPFSEEHKGFLFSEGAACVLVLEELEHALERNAKIYAEITGFESSSDGYSIVSMHEDGRIIKKMLRKLIGDKKIDYYNSHGTATALNDNVEANVIKELFGDKASQPAINSTKAIIGHTLGASGAIEAAVCVNSINHGKVHGNILKTPMEGLNITSETREMNVKRAVSASFGFGGHNAALLIEKFEM